MLDDKLEEYAKRDDYPFHMPGHKRRELLMENPYHIDVTEIPGFDNLHEPAGLILEVMEKMADIYHAKKTYLLVGGSTCGNLAAFSAAVPVGASVIIGRNCHKSIYHGALLRQAKIHYTIPCQNELGFVDYTPLKEYENILNENPDIAAIVVTSPTYEGMLEPIDEIVSLAHSRKIPVIVDAAHGAHLGFHPYFGKSILESGADAVIMSLHKTLPALTQTALLHVGNNSLIDEKMIETYLDVYETSSPSYVLMSSICKCAKFLEDSKEKFEIYVNRLQSFYKDCGKLRNLKVEKRFNQDPSKIIIETKNTSMTGHALEVILREKYGLVLEMSSFNYGLAMTSVMDTEQGFLRLKNALFEIDDIQTISCEKLHVTPKLYEPSQQVLSYHEAMDAKKIEVPLLEAAGMVAGNFVAIYPPGIPLLVPGERIHKETIDVLVEAKNQGLQINGLTDTEGLFIVDYKES